MRIKLVLFALTLLASALLVPAGAATTTTYYFHSLTALSDADEVQEAYLGGKGPFMDEVAPTASTPKVANAAQGNDNFRKNNLLAYWGGALSGTITGNASVEFWAMGEGATSLSVKLFGDGSVGVAPPIATSTVTGVLPAPKKFTADFSGLNASIGKEVVVQIHANTPANTRAGVQVLFDSADYPSSFTFTYEPLVSPPGVTPVGFANYKAPLEDFSWGNSSSAETSIGINPETNAAMAIFSLDTAKITWDDSLSPPKANWTNVSAAGTSITSADPILWVDRATGRTFAVQLLGEFSVVGYTDDDGASWTYTQPPSAAPSFDHETLGGGPYSIHAPLPPGAQRGYPNALYYCAQGVVLSQCARSDDGGNTWGAPLPMNVNKCAGLHGQVQVGPDGSVYVPHKNCQGKAGIVVSRDNGVSWSVIKVPGTNAGDTDPTISFDESGRLWFATGSPDYLNSFERRPVVLSSPDGGLTWSAPSRLGAELGVQTSAFTMAVAGDAGRVAVAYYGSTSTGDGFNTNFVGEWHLYVSSTFDGGATWSTINVTAGDPIQKGWLCMGGTGCTSGRNHLDFQGATVDNQGRVLVSYADGCISTACLGPGGSKANSTNAWITIARQTTGKRLYAEFDPV